MNNVIQQVNNLSGVEPLVVLMHEKPTTAAHLEKLLKYFQENGYEMKPIHDSIKPVHFRWN
ncbi:Peptidoglycan N-acetylglucosamine deacetylase [Bacillus licheniformis]|nr:Peptidoglycan N-acetylglucosamine deacetylase [Bacillus licheniformis]